MENGITPLPSYTQLNNKVVYLRKSHEIHGNITTSTELEGAISKHTEIPGDDKIHKPSLSSFIFNSQGRIWITRLMNFSI